MNSLDEDGADHFVTLTTNAFPSAADIGDLVRSQTGLGVGDVFLLPVELNRYI